MKRFLAIVLSVLTLFLLVSCVVDETPHVENDVEVLETPENDVEALETPENEANEEDAAAQDEPAEVEQDTATYSSVEEYINANPEEFESIAEAYGDSMQLSVSARGNLMVYSIASDLFDYIYEYGETMEGVKTYFDPIIDKMANSMGQAVIEAKKEIPLLQGIVMEYSDSKGNLLYSRIITEEDAYKDYGDGSDVDIFSFNEEMTVEQWVENLSNQNLDSGVGMLNAYADGNMIVYVNTFYGVYSAQDVDLSQLDAYHEEMTSVVSEAMELVAIQVPDLEGVRYEYCLEDGTVFYSYEYNR